MTLLTIVPFVQVTANPWVNALITIGAAVTALGALYKYVWQGTLLPIGHRFTAALDAATEIRDLIAGDILARTTALEHFVQDLSTSQEKLLVFMQASVTQRDAQQKENLAATQEIAKKINSIDSTLHESSDG